MLDQRAITLRRYVESFSVTGCVLRIRKRPCGTTCGTVPSSPVRIGVCTDVSRSAMASGACIGTARRVRSGITSAAVFRTVAGIGAAVEGGTLTG